MRSDAPLIIDSHAWMEYFKGTEPGRRLAKLIEERPAYTPTLVLSEVGFALLRQGMKHEQPLRFIKARSRVVPLTDEIALLTIDVHRERRAKQKNWPIMDSMILATARHLGGKVVTGDPHFDDLGDEVVALE